MDDGLVCARVAHNVIFFYGYSTTSWPKKRDGLGRRANLLSLHAHGYLFPSILIPLLKGRQLLLLDAAQTDAADVD